MSDLQPYIRPHIPGIVQDQITQYLKALRLTPKSNHIQLAARLMLENTRLAEMVLKLREQRGYIPLKQDPEFMAHVEIIEKHAGNLGMVNTLLEVAMQENALLTTEINQHHKALGLPELNPARIKV